MKQLFIKLAKPSPERKKRSPTSKKNLSYMWDAIISAEQSDDKQLRETAQELREKYEPLVRRFCPGKFQLQLDILSPERKEEPKVEPEEDIPTRYPAYTPETRLGNLKALWMALKSMLKSPVESNRIYAAQEMMRIEPLIREHFPELLGEE